jgi:hypothetical protein
MFICTQNKLINQGIAQKTVKTMLAQEIRSLAAPKPTGSTDQPGPVNSDTIGAENGLRRKSLEK